jgi:hypothetical protein
VGSVRGVWGWTFVRRRSAAWGSILTVLQRVVFMEYKDNSDEVVI